MAGTPLSARFPIVTALVLRPMLHERIRSGLTLLGIAVGVAVIVAIQLANQSALGAFRQSVDAVAGRANFQVVPDSGTLDERLLLELRPLWRQGARFAPVIDIEGTIGEAASAQPVRLLAVDLLSDLHFRDYRYAKIEVAGRGEGGGRAGDVPLEQYLGLFRDDAIVLPAPFAAERHLTVGSRVPVTMLGIRRQLVVRGLLEATGPATAFNGSVIVADIGTAQRAFGLEGKLSRIDLMIPEASAARVAASLRLPEGTRLERPSRRNERVEKMLRAFRVNLFALAGVALLVGMFLVYNTVLISILRRRRDVGVLKTLGAAPGQVFRAFLIEGLLFGTAGSLLGILLGKAIASGILRAVGRTIDTLYVSTRPEAVVLQPGVVAAGLAVGILLSLASALHPALEASRVRPSAMIRSGLQQRVARPGLLAVYAAACFLLAGLVSLLPPVGGVAVAGYLAVLLVVGGFSLLAPRIVQLTSRLALPPLERLFGLVGKLAAVSLPASLRRTSVASGALSLAVGMMVAVALMVGSFRETVRIWVDQTVSSDLWLRPARGLTNGGAALFPPGMATRVTALPFVAAIDRARSREVLLGDDVITVGSGDFTVAAARGELPMVAPRSSRRALLEAVRLNGAVISESFSIKFGRGVGDRITVPALHGPLELPVTGIYRDYSNDRGTVVMDRELYARAYDDRAINTIVVYLAEGVDRERARRALGASLGRYGVFVVTSTEVKREVMKIFDQTFMITWALLGVAIVVAVLGIVNTMAALILERTRELALLRVTGLSLQDLRVMVVLESTLLGVASIATGLVMGTALSWILIHVINRQSFGWTIDFHVPAAVIAGSLAVTFTASALAGLVPARLAQRIDIASAIKSE